MAAVSTASTKTLTPTKPQAAAPATPATPATDKPKVKVAPRAPKKATKPKLEPASGAGTGPKPKPKTRSPDEVKTGLASALKGAARSARSLRQPRDSKLSPQDKAKRLAAKRKLAEADNDTGLNLAICNLIRLFGEQATYNILDNVPMPKVYDTKILNLHHQGEIPSTFGTDTDGNWIVEFTPDEGSVYGMGSPYGPWGEFMQFRPPASLRSKPLPKGYTPDPTHVAQHFHHAAAIIGYFMYDIPVDDGSTPSYIETVDYSLEFDEDQSHPETDEDKIDAIYHHLTHHPTCVKHGVTTDNVDEVVAAVLNFYNDRWYRPQ